MVRSAKLAVVGGAKTRGSVTGAAGRALTSTVASTFARPLLWSRTVTSVPA
jgi:hypothetical protein